MRWELFLFGTRSVLGFLLIYNTGILSACPKTQPRARYNFAAAAEWLISLYFPHLFRSFRSECTFQAFDRLKCCCQPAQPCKQYLSNAALHIVQLASFPCKPSQINDFLKSLLQKSRKCVHGTLKKDLLPKPMAKLTPYSIVFNSCKTECSLFQFI